jgi:2'-5' RNA ligase
MRVFIAIDLPQRVKDTLAQIQKGLKKTGADVKWVQANNIHLTLKFLGDIEESALEKLIQAITLAVDHLTGYMINIDRIGAFPRLEAPRIIWAGIDRGARETNKIVEDLEEGLSAIGIPKEEKPFACHITLGRTRSAQGKTGLAHELKTTNAMIRPEELEFMAKQITLFQSTLTPGGPIYKELQAINLATT